MPRLRMRAAPLKSDALRWLSGELLCNGHDIELWCLERMVMRLPAITEKNGRLPDFGT